MGELSFERRALFGRHVPASVFHPSRHATNNDPIQGKTYFTVFARWPGEIRLFSIEWELIETEAEALAAVRENETAAVVFRNDPDIPRVDVSEDIARAWLRDLVAKGLASNADDVPSFIRENLSDDDIERQTIQGQAAE